MKLVSKQLWLLMVGLTILSYGLLMVGCAAGEAVADETAVSATDEHDDDHEHDAEAEMLKLPELAAADLNGSPLKVVATTSIIGDVVGQVGGDAIQLTILIEEMAEHNLCTVFTETSVSDSLAQTVAGELGSCDEVQVLKLYTGSIGPAGSGTDSYIGMFRTNVDLIVAGLR